MLSNLAISDINTLISEGVILTPEEIIKLNFLGLKINDEVGFENISRVAWIGDIPIYEPTIQVSKWLKDFGSKFFKSDKEVLKASIWACCNGTEFKFFEDKIDKKLVKKLINEFDKKINCTDSERDMAFTYVTHQANTQEDDEIIENEVLKNCPYTDLIDQTIATGLNISIAAIKTLTTKRLVKILTNWTRLNISQNGDEIGDLSEQMKTSARVKYYKYLDAIREKYNGK